MLDRLALLNNLLGTDSFPKKASEEDDEFDLPIFSPPKPAEAPKKPIPPPDLSAVPPLTGIVKTPAPQTIAPTPRQRPAWFDPEWKPIPSGAVETIPEEEKSDLPSWFDPEWKPIKKTKVTTKFPTSHWVKLEDEIPENKPEIAPPEPKEPEASPTLEEPPKEKTIIEELGLQQPAAMSVNDALALLETLPENEPLNEAIAAIGEADEALNGENSNNKKFVSTVLSYTIAHLMGLLNHTDEVFKDQKAEAISATQILKDHFQDEVNKLPKKMQEKVSDEIEKAIFGRKRSPLRELTSQFYGPELIFVNNRAIRLMRLRKISVDDAEKEAKEEWTELSNLVDGLVPDFAADDKNELTRIGAQEILSSGDLEAAKSVITKDANTVKSGVIPVKNLSLDRLGEMFPDATFESSADWENEIAQDMIDEDIVRDDISDLPKEIIDTLAPQMVRFGELALKFSKVKEIVDKYKNEGINDDRAVEADNAFQRIYDKLEAMVHKIFCIDSKYITSPLAHEKFQDVYVVYSSVRYMAKEEGLESMNDVPISIGQSAEEGLSPDLRAPGNKNQRSNPRLKRNDETEEEYVIRKKHEKELADASRHRYLRNILATGDVQGYLEKKREYQKEYRLSQKIKEPNEVYQKRIRIENELDRIRNPEYNKNNRELVKWRNLASKKIEDEDLRKQLRYLINSQKERTNKLYERISKSWLPGDEIEKLESSLLENRIEKFQQKYDDLKKFTGTNALVLKALEHVISQIPTYFEEAKQIVHDEKVSSAKITLDMSSMFSKYANRNI